MNLDPSKDYIVDNLIKALEDNFSLHDADEIYNLLSEFSVVDTDCGRITFKQWLIKRRNK